MLHTVSIRSTLTTFINVDIFAKIMSLRNCFSVGISLPKEIIQKIDKERLDVPRSRYLLRIIQDRYNKQKQILQAGAEAEKELVPHSHSSSTIKQ